MLQALRSPLGQLLASAPAAACSDIANRAFLCCWPRCKYQQHPSGRHVTHPSHPVPNPVPNHKTSGQTSGWSAPRVSANYWNHATPGHTSAWCALRFNTPQWATGSCSLYECQGRSRPPPWPWTEHSAAVAANCYDQVWRQCPSSFTNSGYLVFRQLWDV